MNCETPKNYESEKSEKEIFPREIVDNFDKLIQREHPAPLDKIPLTDKNVELLTSAKLHFEELSKVVKEIADGLKESAARKEEGPRSPLLSFRSPDNELPCYPPMAFLEDGQLFIYWTNCEAKPEKIFDLIVDRSIKNQDCRISYPVPPFRLPKYVGLYRQFNLQELDEFAMDQNKKLEALLKQIRQKKLRDLGIEPPEEQG